MVRLSVPLTHCGESQLNWTFVVVCLPNPFARAIFLVTEALLCFGFFQHALLLLIRLFARVGLVDDDNFFEWNVMIMMFVISLKNVNLWVTNMLYRDEKSR